MARSDGCGVKPERLFRPGPTQRRRFQLVEASNGWIPTRQVRLDRTEMLYLEAMGHLHSRGIAGLTKRDMRFVV